MNITNIIEKAFAIIQLKEEDIKDVSQQEEYFGWGLLVIAISGVAYAIGTFKFFPGIILYPIGQLIGAFIIIGIYYLLAKLFGGKADYLSYFRPLAITNILQWVSVIPIVGFFLSVIAGIWQIVVAVKITQIVHELDMPKSIAVILIPIAIIFILILIFGAAALALLGLKGRVPGTI